MLDIDIINSTIAELEHGDTTFNSCEKLASLYIIRQYYSPTESGRNQAPDLNVVKELQDILPSYKNYRDKKFNYQVNNDGKDGMLGALSNVCKEIEEFIITLYRSTDTEDERSLLSSMINTLQGRI